MTGFLPPTLLHEATSPPPSQMTHILSALCGPGQTDLTRTTKWLQLLNATSYHMDLTKEQTFLLYCSFARTGTHPTMQHKQFGVKLDHLYYYNPSTNHISCVSASGEHDFVCPLCCRAFLWRKLPPANVRRTDLLELPTFAIDLPMELIKSSGGKFLHCVHPQRYATRWSSEEELMSCSIWFLKGLQSFAVSSSSPLCWANTIIHDDTICYRSGFAWLAELHVAIAFFLSHLHLAPPEVLKLLVGTDVGRSQRYNLSAWILQTLDGVPFLKVQQLEHTGLVYTAIEPNGRSRGAIFTERPFTMVHMLRACPVVKRFDFSVILGWSGPYGPNHQSYKGFPYNVMLQWASGEVTEEPFDLVWSDATDACVRYAACTDDFPSDLWDLLDVHGRA
jgi:hypothetical protein